MNRSLLILFSFISFSAAAQYAPQAGVSGSTAIPAADARFVAWAKTCAVERGWLDIADKTKGHVNAGGDVLATGPADKTIVSLGDSGVAVLTFENRIYNGPGPDFAVFENGFVSPTDPEDAFLELAFVEVSSDGVNYTRFPASSLTDTPQVPMAGVYMDARKINNLAGKYIGSYGTPFDLEELKNVPGLDVMNITHVRLVDVIGSVGVHSTADKDGNKINDPYPTEIPTGGFDLDAVGVIHVYGKYPAGVNMAGNTMEIAIYPNPAAEFIYINLPEDSRGSIAISRFDGQVIFNEQVNDQRIIVNISKFAAGMYHVLYSDENGKRCAARFIKY